MANGLGWGKPAGVDHRKGQTFICEEDGKVSGVIWVGNIYGAPMPACTGERGVAAGTAVSGFVNMKSKKTISGQTGDPNKKQAAVQKGIK